MSSLSSPTWCSARSSTSAGPSSGPRAAMASTAARTRASLSGNSTAPRRFDLVIGADGLHSTVRRLAFGPERDVVRHMGVYVATMPLDGPVDRPHDVLMYNTPGRLVSIHPARGNALAAFITAALTNRDQESLSG